MLLSMSQIQYPPTSAMERLPPISSLPYEVVSRICQYPALNKDDLVAVGWIFETLRG